MQYEEYVKIKLNGQPRNIFKVIEHIKQVYNVSLTSPMIQHRNDNLSHIYVTIYPREACK